MYFASLRGRLTIAALLAFLLQVSAQRPQAQPNAAEILHRMQKLQVVGSVLYIAAHPDDENTRLITWLANGKKVRTGYLSLTRGEGGQNLIGPELGDALGIIRTQELLEARRIDGGEQFFTRAVDFGYSKSAEESFEKWGKQEVLGDVVCVIRKFQPDVIITRFPPTRDAGHGHHEASAILAREAFDLAGDPKAFPEQLEQGLQVWQPRRLFFNASTWWKENLAEIVKSDTTGEWYSVDVGGYDPLLGLSYTEIAGRSRSMHKSQGFGAAETRGEMLEYLHLEKGDGPKNKDVFEGIDMTWSRVPEGKLIGAQVDSLTRTYDVAAPERSEPLLGRLLNRIRSLEKCSGRARLQETKVRSIHDLMKWCAGLNLEATAGDRMISTADSAKCVMKAVLRRPIDMRPSDKAFLRASGSWDAPPFQVNVPVEIKYEAAAPAAIDQPFWLAKPHKNLYAISDPSLVGTAASDQQLNAILGCYLTAERSSIQFTTPTQFKWVDRVAGERIRPVYVTPVASVTPKDKVIIGTKDRRTIKVTVEALTDGLKGNLSATAPKGWTVVNEAASTQPLKRGESFVFELELIQAANAEAGVVHFTFSSNKGNADRTLHEIDYPHIMPQVYYTPAEIKLVPLDVKTTARTVGYIKGAGDEVPQAIEQLGVKVDMIDPGTATLESLRKYDAIVTGIRAYNTVKALKDLNPVLMRYMEEGGTLVVQYNTLSRDMVLPDSLFGPYPFTLTRDRVTVEEASCKLLAGDHPLLNSPNKIGAGDFDDWTQERGLYFCGKLDPHYTPLLSWNDPGEDPLNGALITCDYGKGRYVYTGISFFRQLPAGVAGAYRLFANLIEPRRAE